MVIRIVDMEKKNTQLPGTTDSGRIISENFITVLPCADSTRFSGRALDADLERVFFHDILNMAGVVEGFSEVIADAKTLAEAKTSAVHISRASKIMVDAIRHYHLMRDAKTGALRVKIEPVKASELVTELASSLAEVNALCNKELTLTCPPDLVLETDAVLLRRILINMLTNAFEATPCGGEVDLTAKEVAGLVVFTVANSTVIPAEMRPNLFRPDHSTKGPGRGLGLYSIKLLGEQYLNGKIGFASVPNAGTVFMAEFPIRAFVKSCA